MVSKNNKIQGEKMLNLLEDNENYRNLDLDLYTFAKILGISPRELSSIVHQNFQVGYREFLNQFRIKKAKELIEQHKNKYKVQEYAKKVGYRSRITFFNAFKHHLGMSPAAFIKSLDQRG